MKPKFAFFGLCAFAVLPALAALPGRSAARPMSDHTAVPDLAPAMIDHEIRLAWKQQGILPAPAADDARYFRRIYLDITGIIPTDDAVRAFLADKDPDRRARAVDSLLSSPRYTENWTNYWENTLMGNTARSQVLDRVAFRQWLKGQFEKNTHWNTFVYNLITATGQNSTGGSYAKVMGMETPADKMMAAGQTTPAGRPSQTGKAMTGNQSVMADKMDKTMSADPAMQAGGTGTPVGDVNVNGAVNWILKYQGKPEDLSGSASKIFLGVQIQCAQCHDHKTEKWKQEDFRRFTACFMNTRPRPIDIGVIKGLRRVELIDVNRPFVPRNKKIAGNAAEYAFAQPTALDGTDFSTTPNRRQALAAWITSDSNPWFAETIVNRIWAHFMGRGFVEPIDDFRPSNPAIMPELMQQLADDFKAHDYDLKHLIKTICATQVYQLSSAKAVKADPDNKYWARFRLKPMNADELLDSLVTATNLTPVLEKIAGGRLDQVKFAMKRNFTFLFDVDEEFEQKDFEGTIPAALMLLNGGITNGGVTAIPGTAQADVMALPGTDADKITALYLKTLARKPTVSEITKWTSFVNAPRDVILDNTTPNAPDPRTNRQAIRLVGKQAGKQNTGPNDPVANMARHFQVAANVTPKQQAYEDLFWALLNSSEFMFNH